MNVRTYVRAGSRRGVWFFSLDVDRRLAAVVARTVYALPYCYGRAEHHRVGNLVTSTVRRRWPRPGGKASTHLAVRTGDRADRDAPLEHFLTSRWGLITATRRGALRWAPVDHQPWPLHHGEAVHVDDHLVTEAGLPAPNGSPHVLWAPSVDVRVGRPTRIARSS